MLFLHILAGLAALVAGAAALLARKGGPWHRKTGLIFVYTMLFMSATGALMALLRSGRISAVAGLLTFYLVSTALLTVRPRDERSAWIDRTCVFVALAVSATGFTFALMASRAPDGRLDGLPPAPAYMFGAVALLAAAGDVRVAWTGGLTGARRLARHLWRMCFALFIATASFFLGQAKLFPREVRGFLGLPVLAVLLSMAFWLVRVRRAARWRTA